MILFEPDDFLLPPRPYQYDGLAHIFNQFHEIKRPQGSENFAAIFDEMGVGKTKQAIDAASIKFQMKEIDMAIVVCPKTVLGVWDDEETGEISKHCKSDYISIRYNADFKSHFPVSDSQLIWVTVSYSFLRSRIEAFIKEVEYAQMPFMLICDESSFIKSHSAQQTKAVKELRAYASHCLILNGTPGDKLKDLWSQFDILDPRSIDNIGYHHFINRYCIKGGYEGKQIFDFNPKELAKAEEEITQYLNELRTNPSDRLLAKLHTRQDQVEYMIRVRDAIDRLKTKLKPWVIRREKKDVLKDLPAKIPPVYIEAEMSAEGYRIYTEMKNDMVAWASDAEMSQAVNGAVKLGRLSQITSGFLGGIEIMPVIDEMTDGTIDTHEIIQERIGEFGGPREVDRAKLNAFLEWFDCNSDHQVVVWCRYRAEMFRLQKELNDKGVTTSLIIGGQKEYERQEHINAFKTGRAQVCIANRRSGGYGLNLTNCHISVSLSMSHSLIEELQASDRLHRSGQTEPVSYIYILAVAPRTRAKTVDHLIVNTVLNKEDVANWSMDKWREKVKEL